MACPGMHGKECGEEIVGSSFRLPLGGLCRGCLRRVVFEQRTEGAGRVVSAIIPTYNTEPSLLVAAIGSALVQPQVAEVIVVDDGSTIPGIVEKATRSGFHRWVEPTRVRVMRQENGGQACAIIRGLAEARMPIVALLDADDEWSFFWLERAVGLMFQDRTLDGIVGYAQETTVTRKSGRATVYDRVGTPKLARLFSSLVIWHDAFEKIGPPALNLGMGTTLEWFERAKERGNLGVMTAVYFRKLHDQNYTRTHRGDMHEYHRAVKIILDRRRAAGG